MRTAYQNNQIMKVKVEQAINKARNNESLEGLIIEDLKDTQVRAVDALALAEQGVVIPEQNIFYDDNDIAYDPDFDDIEWNNKPLKMTWEEKIELAEKMAENKNNEDEITVKIKVTDQEVRQWINENYDKMGQILGDFAIDIYKANKIIKG